MLLAIIMKIAVNTRFLLSGKLEGIGWFTYETLRRITQQHPEHEFYFLFDRPFHQEFIFSDNVKPIVLFPPARHPLLWHWWFQYSVAKALKKIQPDIFLSPDGYACLHTDVRTLLVIHDLAFEHYPQFVNKTSAWYYQYFTPKFCQKAHHIATVSEFTKQDIVSKYDIDAQKITVTYNGANNAFQPLLNDEMQQVKKKYSQGQDYFVYAGSLHPRKNIARLFQAFDQFKKETKSEKKLVLAGARGWMLKEIDEVYQNMQYKNELVFTGHLHINELVRVIGAAYAMVYVSVFEGFGIPILEAMQCNIPVITSNITSMPEVAGDAAILVNPFDVNSIAEALMKIDNNKKYTEELTAKGNIQKQQFSWDKTADELWQLMLKVGQ